MAANAVYEWDTSTSSYTAEYDGTGWVTVGPVNKEERELTLDELLFDDDETLERKRKGYEDYVLYVEYPANVDVDDLVSAPGNVIYTTSNSTANDEWSK